MKKLSKAIPLPQKVLDTADPEKVRTYARDLHDSLEFTLKEIIRRANEMLPKDGTEDLDADPTTPLGAATKQYVDDAIAALPGPAGLKSRQIFTGNGTWTRPAGVTKVIIEVIAGGSGGGGANTNGSVSAAAGGGGSGGYSRRFIDVSAIATATITVGTGGLGGTTGGNTGLSGNNSTWSDGTNLVRGLGGVGGTGTGTATVDRIMGGSSGGNADGGDISVKGGAGGNASMNPNGDTLNGGCGGAGHFGGAGVGGKRLSTGRATGDFGQVGGGGGGAACKDIGSPGAAGGAGGAGLVIVWEYA